MGTGKRGDGRRQTVNKGRCVTSGDGKAILQIIVAEKEFHVAEGGASSSASCCTPGGLSPRPFPSGGLRRDALFTLQSPFCGGFRHRNLFTLGRPVTSSLSSLLAEVETSGWIIAARFFDLGVVIKERCRSHASKDTISARALSRHLSLNTTPLHVNS